MAINPHRERSEPTLILRRFSRLVAAPEGINGVLMIGWSTAYLVAAATRHGPFRRGDHF